MKFHLKLACLAKTNEQTKKMNQKNPVVIVSVFLESIQDPCSPEIIKIIGNGSSRILQQYKKDKKMLFTQSPKITNFELLR